MFTMVLALIVCSNIDYAGKLGNFSSGCVFGTSIIWIQILIVNLLMIDMQLIYPGIHEDSYIAEKRVKIC